MVLYGLVSGALKTACRGFDSLSGHCSEAAATPVVSDLYDRLARRHRLPLHRQVPPHRLDDLHREGVQGLESFPDDAIVALAPELVPIGDIHQAHHYPRPAARLPDAALAPPVERQHTPHH